MELVNPVPVEECEPWMAALVTTLLGAPWDDDFGRHVERWRRDWLADRTWGVQDRGRWVATLATDARTLTVPGSPGTTVDVSADALTAVTVAATHRRQGLLTKMITQSLQQAVDRGDPVAVLIAAEWPIYGRFGYAPATQGADYTLFTRRAGATVRPDPAGNAAADRTGRAQQVRRRDLRQRAAPLARPGRSPRRVVVAAAGHRRLRADGQRAGHLDPARNRRRARRLPRLEGQP